MIMMEEIQCHAYKSTHHRREHSTLPMVQYCSISNWQRACMHIHSLGEGACFWTIVAVNFSTHPCIESLHLCACTALRPTGVLSHSDDIQHVGRLQCRDGAVWWILEGGLVVHMSSRAAFSTVPGLSIESFNASSHGKPWRIPMKCFLPCVKAYRCHHYNTIDAIVHVCTSFNFNFRLFDGPPSELPDVNLTKQNILETLISS